MEVTNALQLVTHGEEQIVIAPFNFTIPEWIWIILITVVVAGLVKYAWHSQGRRIDKMEEWKTNLESGGGIVTMDAHRRLCEKLSSTKEQDMNEAFVQFKEWLSLKLDIVNNRMVTLQNEIELNRKFLDDKIENKILKELHKLNGKS